MYKARLEQTVIQITGTNLLFRLPAGMTPSANMTTRSHFEIDGQMISIYDCNGFINPMLDQVPLLQYLN